MFFLKCILLTFSMNIVTCNYVSTNISTTARRVWGWWAWWTTRQRSYRTRRTSRETWNGLCQTPEWATQGMTKRSSSISEIYSSAFLIKVRFKIQMTYPWSGLTRCALAMMFFPAFETESPPAWISYDENEKAINRKIIELKKKILLFLFVSPSIRCSLWAVPSML